MPQITKSSLLEKTFVLRPGIRVYAVEYCTPGKENGLGEKLCERVALPKSSPFSEGVQDKE